MSEFYEMDDPDRELVPVVRRAIEFSENGDPVKDAIDEDQMVDAMRLLLQIVDAGFAR